MNHEHHDLPTSGRALTGVAAQATLHCLTGCAIGEVLGMVIGTALGLSMAHGRARRRARLPLRLPADQRAAAARGPGLAAVVPVALAADTVSIAVMEIVDNAVMLLIPGAMDAGLDSLLFWGALAFALAVAFVVALPVNRWLIARGKGHTAVHRTGVHGGPSPRVVGTILAIAFVFGAGVLLAEIVDGDDTEPVDAGADLRSLPRGGIFCRVMDATSPAPILLDQQFAAVRLRDRSNPLEVRLLVGRRWQCPALGGPAHPLGPGSRIRLGCK